jgi:hypothetical protein
VRTEALDLLREHIPSAGGHGLSSSGMIMRIDKKCMMAVMHRESLETSHNANTLQVIALAKEGDP